MGGAALLVVVGLAVGVSYSAVFRVRTLEVRGEGHLSKSDVVALAGITSRTNVVWLDAGEVEHRLESSPWIASAAVHRSLPSTVSIEIEEREPVAAVEQDSGFALLARDGTQLAAVPEDPGLPVIAGRPGFWPGSAALRGPSVYGPARSLAAMPPRLRRQVDRLLVDDRGDLRLILANGVRVLYGAPAQAEAKALALLALLRWADSQATPLVSIDVRAPNAPTALMRTTA